MSIPSELGHLAMPTNFLAGKNQMAQANFEPGTSQSRVLRCAAMPHWLGMWYGVGLHPFKEVVYTPRFEDSA